MTGNGHSHGAPLDFELLNNRLSALFAGNGDGWRSTGWTPAVTLQETDAAMVLTMEVPGVSEEEIDVQLEGRTLVVQGRKAEPSVEAARSLVSERAFGPFRRAFRVPGWVDGDRIDAQLAHGVLTLTLPKAESAKPRRIALGGTEPRN